ncbi:uncharacterized protein LOC113229686 [Hyposmocoma kahamanoa]|uniref:uncharacterized protein LOC113229686 n=1 Tax=Hyposmocoma kahamanoa TaxID=1477025 RepID=UPI000E6D685D|nr:uncharacterized protein LOC113229686 [Hyposmocoma kahamanoa]
MEYTETLPIYTNMAYYPIFNTFSYSYPFHDWNTIITTIPTATTIYTTPITTAPIFYEFPQMYSPQVYPYSRAVTQHAYTEPVFSPEQSIPEFNPFVPPPYIDYEQPLVEEIYNTSQEEASVHDVTNNASTSSSIANTSFSTANTSFNTPDTSFSTPNTSSNTPNTSFNASTTSFNTANVVANVTARPSFRGPITRGEPVEPWEYYLQLPKKLFPPPRYLKIDPNPLIDAFCILSDIQNQLSWISDLEFGVPRVATKRQIAQYDIKIKNVICKNSTGVTYPAFDSCNREFKHIVSSYYDLVINTWYKGYVKLKRNKSRSCFEAWISRPMETFGMCWP